MLPAKPAQSSGFKSATEMINRIYSSAFALCAQFYTCYSNEMSAIWNLQDSDICNLT